MTHRVYGSWMYADPEGDYRLAWYRKLPAWALLPTDSKAACRFVNELAHFLGTAPTHAALVEFASRPPANSGISVAGTTTSRSFDLEFAPPLPALTVARSLEIRRPYAISSDVHMQSWKLHDHESPTRLQYPEYGGWVVEAALTGWPSGGKSPEGLGRNELAARDCVRWLTMRLRESYDD